MRNTNKKKHVNTLHLLQFDWQPWCLGSFSFSSSSYFFQFEVRLPIETEEWSRSR